VQDIEVRHAIEAKHYGLAVDHKLLAAIAARGLHDPREALGPIIAAARDQPDAIAVTLDAKAIPVIFDFVKPLGACRHGFSEGGQAELEFGHGTDIDLPAGDYESQTAPV
jgi:hypothetical protein